MPSTHSSAPWRAALPSTSSSTTSSDSPPSRPKRFLPMNRVARKFSKPSAATSFSSMRSLAAASGPAASAAASTRSAIHARRRGHEMYPNSAPIEPQYAFCRKATMSASVARAPMGSEPVPKVLGRSLPVRPNSESASSCGIGRTVPSGSSVAPRWPSRRYASISASTFDCAGSAPPAEAVVPSAAAGRSRPSSKPRKNWFHESPTLAGSRCHAACICSMYSGLHALTARPVEASEAFLLDSWPEVSDMVAIAPDKAERRWIVGETAVSVMLGSTVIPACAGSPRETMPIFRLPMAPRRRGCHMRATGSTSTA